MAHLLRRAVAKLIDGDREPLDSLRRRGVKIGSLDAIGLACEHQSPQAASAIDVLAECGFVSSQEAFDCAFKAAIADADPSNELAWIATLQALWRAKGDEVDDFDVPLDDVLLKEKAHLFRTCVEDFGAGPRDFSRFDDEGSIQFMLKHYPAWIDERFNYGSQPLLHAALNDDGGGDCADEIRNFILGVLKKRWRSKAVLLLLACGMDPLETDSLNGGKTAMQLAEQSEDVFRVEAASQMMHKKKRMTDDPTIVAAAKEIRRRRMQLIEARASTVCIALQSLRLPATVLLAIVDATCEPFAVCVRTDAKLALVEVVTGNFEL